MATVTGRSATVSLDDSGGSARVITGYISDSNIDHTSDFESDSGYGATFKSKVATLKDWKVSMTGMYDTTATTGSHTVISGVVGTSGTITISPDGGTSTASGEVICTKYSPSIPVGGIVTFTADFEGNGALTWS